MWPFKIMNFRISERQYNNYNVFETVTAKAIESNLSYQRNSTIVALHVHTVLSFIQAYKAA